MVSILGQTPENVRQLMFEAPSDYGVDTSKQCSECADYDSNGLPEFRHSPTLRQTSSGFRSSGETTTTVI